MYNLNFPKIEAKFDFMIWNHYFIFQAENKHIYKATKHPSRMLTNRAVTGMSSDRVPLRPIVYRMTQAWKNINFHCGR